ncbi:hypothetical protein IAU59_000905 [Kwoniella sp. CBS 9459]
MSRPRDIDAFLASYKGQSSPSVDGQADNNLRFYKNEIVCQPDGLKYESWMKRYENDLVELEMNQSVIRLFFFVPRNSQERFFPIREQGVNHLAQPLDVHEIEAMKEDPAVLDRLLRSYKMMLRFYGIEFNDGHLKLSEDYKERLLNLKQRPHNLLRITRIMKHLSEFPQLQPHVAPLVLFFVALHSEGLLDFSQGSMRGDSLDRWWSNVFRDEEERSAVRRIVGARGKLGGKDWGWEEYGRWMSERGEKGYTGSEVERG